MVFGVRGSHTVGLGGVQRSFGTIFGGRGGDGGAAPVNIIASCKALVAAARAAASRDGGEVSPGGTGCTTPAPLPPWPSPSVDKSQAAKVEGEAIRLRENTAKKWH